MPFEALTEKREEYVTWRADPQRAGTKTDWARAHEVGTETLRRWEKEDWFKTALDERLRENHLGTDSILEVIAGIQGAAKGGDVQAAKTYLAFLEKVQPMKPSLDDGDLKGMSTDELYALLDSAVD